MGVVQLFKVQVRSAAVGQAAVRSLISDFRSTDMEWLETFWATYSTLVLSIGTNVLLALSIYLTLACGLLTVANAAFMGIGSLYGGVA